MDVATIQLVDTKNNGIPYDEWKQVYDDYKRRKEWKSNAIEFLKILITVGIAVGVGFISIQGQVSTLQNQVREARGLKFHIKFNHRKQRLFI